MAEKMTAYDATTKVREEIEAGGIDDLYIAYLRFETLIGRPGTADEYVCVQSAWIAIKGDEEDDEYDDYESSSEEY